MFRLQSTKNHLPVKSEERIEFNFSNFKALQVPRGWDDLYVSIISAETRKAVAKLNKAAVEDGKCQWSEAVSESLWIFPDEASQELQDCLFRLVVAQGSARSGILGEITINIVNYMSSIASVPVSLPLKRCNHGTILQFNIECLTQRPEVSDMETKGTVSKEDTNEISQEIEIKLKLSNGTLAKSEASYSREDVISSINHDDSPRRSSFSLSSSQSYDSARHSTGRENFFRPSNTSNDGHDLSGRQDLHILQNVAAGSSYNAKNPSRLSQSSFSSRITHSDDLSQDDLVEFPASSSRNSYSSKSMLEAAEETIQELQEEAKMWERNATKLMLDLELLRKEHSEQSNVHANLEMEISATCAERDGLQNEVKQLKSVLEKSIVKSVAIEDSVFQDEGVVHLMKELENEKKFQQESNTNLALQLKKSQESNVELVSVLQELEEIVEKQKVEIGNHSELRSKYCDLLESEKKFQAKVQELEQALKDRNKEDANLKFWTLDIEKEYQQKLSAKEKEIVRLKSKLFEFLQRTPGSVEMQPTDKFDRDLIKEIEALKFKLQDLEGECQELTDENLRLLLELEATKNSSKVEGVYLGSSMPEVRNPENERYNLEEKLKKKLLNEIMEEHNLSAGKLESEKLELEMKIMELTKELKESKELIEKLETELLLKEEKIRNLQMNQTEVESKLSVLQKEKDRLEENINIVTRESDIATRCLNDLQNDLMLLSSNVDSHVSANKYLQRKSSELESDKRELENQLSKLREENEGLSASASGLESKLRCLEESTSFDLERSKSHVATLEAETARLRREMETQNTDHKQKQQELEEQCSEAHEKLEYLRKANPKLEATVESLKEQCSSLQHSKGELKRQNMELQESCTDLDTRLRESHRSLTEYSSRIKNLDEQISSVLQNSASKEQSLTSQMDLLSEEIQKQNKKYSLLNQKYLEKMAENESLGREVRELALQLSTTRDEKEKLASDARREVSNLRASIVKLESDLHTTKVKSEAQVRSLMDELDALKKNQEVLKTDNAKKVKMLDSYKSQEEKFKTTLNDLELRLTVSEYERQQLTDKFTNLKAQSLEIGAIHDEVVSLKNELDAAKFQKEKFETSLHLVSEECETLKLEKGSFLGMIATLKQAVSELEDFKENRISVEKELLRMESETMAKEALVEQNEDCKNELSQIRRTNLQLQRQIKQLEEEKCESTRKAQSLEEELKMVKKQSHRELIAIESPKGDNGYAYDDVENHAAHVDPTLKIRNLEDEPAKALLSNKQYRARLRKLTLEGQKDHTGSISEEKSELSKSSLKKELKEIQDRYFHMSLKYAEVEAQREELVMKLKAAQPTSR
ncbi:hypothetical protein K2173_002135 [Erythroxylum novogranatense]|uniref:C2 NT-type domain-containing protein n=1 Tax=Erythroxylum novogranatense TaxID=1862640 RepID=A0AAV8SQC8_9ROSI|nr:hypothetical protein K2173_002135 [Erythroxylum novogranatense]